MRCQLVLPLAYVREHLISERERGRGREGKRERGGERERGKERGREGEREREREGETEGKRRIEKVELIAMATHQQCRTAWSHSDEAEQTQT